MKKILKTIFISLILSICIMSYIGYSSPDRFPTCFHLSNITAAFLSSILILTYPPPHDFKPNHLKIRILIAIVIILIWFGTTSYFIQYPLSSYSEPMDCFIAIWEIATLTFFTLTFFSHALIGKNYLKKID